MDPHYTPVSREKHLDEHEIPEKPQKTTSALDAV